MTSTTTTTSAAPAQAQHPNTTVRAYFTGGVRDYPNTIKLRDNNVTLHKSQTVGTPEFWSDDRNTWMSGTRAVQLLAANKAVAL